ncbi:MAG TPA: FAD-linked oxidase C-terminal domain-containing protein [Ktedonobacterales bacterium]|jgi:glycolate oxidase|nr:FAD-linked oxidase C-terminal domain-containing protein [Ktedonobacterales bacterium]
MDVTSASPQLAAPARERLAADLRAALGSGSVLTERAELLAYGFDASFLEATPDIVTLPRTPDEVARAARIATDAGAPVVARGSGTGLCGGAVPIRGGVVISTARLNHIRRIDAINRLAVVEPGVINVMLSEAARPYGLYYAPDPASQRISSIGGNVATNAGGPHCLALGATAAHIVAVQVALPDGQLIWLGDENGALNTSGYDLLGAVIGSEGTLAIVTQIVTRLLPLPESVRTLLAIFPDIATGSAAVSAIIGAGIVPSALEMMDRTICQAVERAFHAGYPEDAGSVLLIEVDGPREMVEAQAERIAIICAMSGARETRVARSEAERAALWAGRKGAAAALGQFTSSFYLQDAVVPRSRLPQIMERVEEIAAEYGLLIPNVFHAGDGNLHPNMVFDRRKPGDIERVMRAGNDLLKACVDLGGMVSGEHGIGLEKRDAMSYVFSARDLASMAQVRLAFDPHELFNPDKIFPESAACLEARAPVGLASGVNAWFC